MIKLLEVSGIASSRHRRALPIAGWCQRRSFVCHAECACGYHRACTVRRCGGRCGFVLILTTRCDWNADAIGVVCGGSFLELGCQANSSSGTNLYESEQDKNNIDWK